MVYYYRNGKVFRNGKSDKKGNLFGKWNYYNIAGYLSDTREFFIINDDYKLNQLWYFNKKGDTIINANPKFNVYQQKEFASSKVSESSIFLNFSYYPKRDTIKVNENLSIDVEDLYPFWATKNSEEFMVIAKQKNNFNSNFSNINQVKLDTVYNSFTLKSNWKYKKAIDLKHSMFLDIAFTTPGKKILRGYVVEFYKAKPNDKKFEMERRTYFEKVIYVENKASR